MTPQRGDHFAENTLRDADSPFDYWQFVPLPTDYPEIEEDREYLESLGARQRLIAGEATFATPTERHLGLPSRDRTIEDHAQEARRMGNQWRRTYASHAEAHHPEYMRHASRFVPR